MRGRAPRGAGTSAAGANYVLGMNMSQQASRIQTQVGDSIGNLNWSVVNDPDTKPVIRSIIARIT